MFRDRSDAAERLAAALQPLPEPDPVVLGLPRGGVPVAGVVARALGAELDVIVVRKLGAPSAPEYAVGAIGEGGVRFVDEALSRTLAVTAAALDVVERAEHCELVRRAALYRGGGAARTLAGRTAVIVDDGIATGATATVAAEEARRRGARLVVVAAPVAPRDALPALERIADRVVVLRTPEPFGAVGRFYDDFRPTSDADVMAWLDARAREDGAAQRRRAPG